MPSVRVQRERRRLRAAWRNWLIGAGKLFGVSVEASPHHERFVFTKPFYAHLVRVLKGKCPPDSVESFRFTEGPTFVDLSRFKPPQKDPFPPPYFEEPPVWATKNPSEILADLNVLAKLITSETWQGYSVGIGEKIMVGMFLETLLVQCVVYIKRPATLEQKPEAVRLAQEILRKRMLRAKMVILSPTWQRFRDKAKHAEFHERLFSEI